VTDATAGENTGDAPPLTIVIADDQTLAGVS